jgi:glutathione S-transferase
MSLPNLKLVSFKLCPYVQRAVITLLEKNIRHEVTYIDLGSPPEWFYDISPLEKVPVLLVDDEPLFESMAICEYLDEITPGSLYPADPFRKAQNRAWIEFGNDLLATLYGYFTSPDETTCKQKKLIAQDRLETLEDYFSGGPYFNGEHFSLVDAVYGPIFRNLNCLQGMYDDKLLADAPAIAAWREHLLQRPSVQNAVPATFTEDFCAYVKRSGSHFSQLAEL